MDSWRTINGWGLVCALAVLGCWAGQAAADRISEPPPLVWDCVARGEIDVGAYWQGLWDRDSDAQTSSLPGDGVRVTAGAWLPDVGDRWSEAEGLAGVSADGSGVRASMDGDITGTAQLGISLYAGGYALVEVAEGYPAGTPLWLNVSAETHQGPDLDPLDPVAWSLVISRADPRHETLAIVDQNNLSTQIPIVVGKPLGIVFDAYLGWSASQGGHWLSEDWDIDLAVVPEPTALCLLGFGILLARRRRATP